MHGDTSRKYPDTFLVIWVVNLNLKTFKRHKNCAISKFNEDMLNLNWSLTRLKNLSELIFLRRLYVIISIKFTLFVFIL